MSPNTRTGLLGIEPFGSLTTGDRKRIGEDIEITFDEPIHHLEKRFDAVGWGLLFLLFAALSLPNGNAEYASAAAVGALMLVNNLARRLMDVPVRWFSVVLGASFLIGGTTAVYGIKMDVLALFFAIGGVVLIAGAFVPGGRTKEAAAA